MNLKREIIKFKQYRLFYVVLFFVIGAYASQCQNISRNEQTIKNINTKKDIPMKLNNLTKEEQYVIINKGTERPFTVSILIILRKVHISVGNVTHLYINLNLNFIQVVAGQVLMMK